MDQKKGSAGGKATATVRRQQALEAYHTSPRLCKYCNAILEVGPTQKVSEVKRKKFCNNSCAASYSNKRKSKAKICKDCGEVLHAEGRRNYCSKCADLRRSRTISNSSIGELFGRSKNYTSARSSIARLAREVFKKHEGACECVVCKYNLYVEICHIKDVKDFHRDTKISTVNNIENLVALCPTHHWEFDNGHLDIGDFIVDLNLIKS